MATNRLAYYLALMLSCASATAPSAAAWSNGGYSGGVNDPGYGTHDWIADMALTLQTRNVSFLSTTYHAEFLLGTEAPDNSNYISDCETHHVYYYETGAVQDDIGAVRAMDMHDLAYEYLESRNLSQAAFYIGAMAHYIADIGVFGHTMGTDSDWGAEGHHADYEDAVESMLSSLSPPSTVSLGNKTPCEATLDLAKDITFGIETIRNNVWMDYQYDWSNSTFRISAIASLYASVGAVAAAVNYLMMEEEALPPPEEGPLTSPEEDSLMPPVDEPLIPESGPSLSPAATLATTAAVAILATVYLVILISRLVETRRKEV